MAAPPPPTIFIRPDSQPSSIVYTVNPVDANISSFNLSVDGPGASNYSFQATSNWYQYTVNDLTFGSNYSASIVQTNNSGVASAPSVYRTVQTGNKPDPVQSLAGVKGSNSVSLTWDAPASNGGANVNWYVIRNLSDSIKYNTVGFSNSFIAPYSGGAKNYSVEAVNDPGYSPRVYFSTINTVAISWNSSFYTVLSASSVESTSATPNNGQWSAFVVSQQGYQSNFTFSARQTQTSLGVIIGVNTSATPGINLPYNTARYALYPAGNGNLYNIENGFINCNFGSYSVNDVISLEFGTTTFSYKKNNVVLDTKSFTAGTYYMFINTDAKNVLNDEISLIAS